MKSVFEDRDKYVKYSTYFLIYLALSRKKVYTLVIAQSGKVGHEERPD